MTQKTFADLNWELKQKKTRRERFLEEMAVAVPWKELEKLVKPVAPRAEPGELGGRPGYRVSVMLRIYFCQTWDNLSDDGMEDTLYDSESISSSPIKVFSLKLGPSWMQPLSMPLPQPRTSQSSEIQRCGIPRKETSSISG